MAWWIKGNYSYAGPGFDWLDGGSAPMSSGGLSTSLAVRPEHIPNTARYRKSYPKPPSPDLFYVASATACTPRFKALVEQFEPGMHLFVPIKLQYHDGRAMEGEYYFFNCNVDVDCVLTDNKPGWFFTSRYGEKSPQIGLIQKLTPLEISLSKPQIEGRHLWTGGVLGWNQLFVSDAFCAALRKARIPTIDVWRECHEVDRPWIAEEHMGPLLDRWKDFVESGRTITMGWI